LHTISNLKPIKERFNQLFEKYISNASLTNPLIIQLIDEYNGSLNSIIKKDYDSTPLTYLFRFIICNVVHSMVEAISSVSNSIT
jgi:hypothetical protein